MEFQLNQKDSKHQHKGALRFLLAGALALMLMAGACGGSRSSTSSLLAENETPQGTTERIEAFNREVSRPMLQCPQRVWPGYDFKNMTIYLSDAEKRLAFRWHAEANETTGRVTPIDFSTIEPEFTTGAFSKGKDLSQREIGLSLDKTARYNKTEGAGEFLVMLGIHEGFHLFAQRAWQRAGNNNSSRATEYPSLARPRYLRHMMIKTMTDYLLQGNPVRLKELAFLYDTYNAEYAAESQKLTSTDQTEGTARYADEVSQAISKLGCQASEDELRTELARKFSDNAYYLTDGDSESYTLGALAGLILRSMANHKGWESKIISGATPLSLLVEGLARQAPATDEQAKADLERLIESQNLRRAPKIDEFVNAQDDMSMTRVVVSSERILGSYSTSAFVLVTAQNLELNMDFSATFTAKNKDGSSIEVASTSTDTSASQNPCASHGFLFFIKQTALNPALTGGRLSINHERLKAKGVAYELKKDERGHTFLCL
ncbi:MAG: hypothetical protein HQK54_03640 [Oligoflexales bacterium]|nr:hypothetical protein [Oligoflexales bacterium]